MAIYFSEKFKNFRKTRNLTQEQIADIFHVSPQAVSRWENGATYPDIEILPALADFFGVNVDDLLGVDIRKKEEQMEEVIKQMTNARDKQLVDEEVEILRNALTEFPNDLYLLECLADALHNKAWQYKNIGQEDESKKYAEEAIKIFKRIVNESNNYTFMSVLDKYGGYSYESARYGAIQGIAYTYYQTGEIDKAVEWAKKLPNIDCTAQNVLSRILKNEKGEEIVKQITWNIYKYSNALKDELNFFCKCISENADILEKIERFKDFVTEIEEYTKKFV